MQIRPYCSILGACLWITNTCHPDIAYAIHVLQHFQANLGPNHWSALLQLSGYLRLIFKKDGDLNVVKLTDADWGQCVDDRKSLLGYIFKFGGAAISWQVRKQKTVSQSIAEAEYYGTYYTCMGQVVFWLWNFWNIT